MKLLLLLLVALPCLAVADFPFSEDDERSEGLEPVHAISHTERSARHVPFGLFGKCNFFNCKGKCCNSSFCCPFSGAKCCPDNKCCPKGTLCCPVGCCPKGQDCCAGGCCSDGQKCCGQWCCKKKQQCGNTMNSCYN
ncbi:hypothetical protein CDAR_125681 [Caerostris darwini]|uniref:Uncharacterized protein n=1 Tax=Caerostris darwini TaxID=1538125 RepID=A0AAV4TNX8_9ARAC|nr:hypothetical protein CDAR_125681 [Caerostris darwini]